MAAPGGALGAHTNLRPPPGFAMVHLRLQAYTPNLHAFTDKIIIKLKEFHLCTMSCVTSLVFVQGVGTPAMFLLIPNEMIWVCSFNNCGYNKKMCKPTVMHPPSRILDLPPEESGYEAVYEAN